MKQFKTGKGEFLLVPTPEGCHGSFVNMGYLIFMQPAYENWVDDKTIANPAKLLKFLDKHKDNSDFKKGYIKLPDLSLTFLGVTKSGLLSHHHASQNLIEETAQHIVDDNGMGMWDNYRLKKDEIYTCTSAMDSLACLLRTMGLENNSHCAIFKITNQ